MKRKLTRRQISCVNIAEPHDGCHANGAGKPESFLTIRHRGHRNSTAARHVVVLAVRSCSESQMEWRLNSATALFFTL